MDGFEKRRFAFEVLTHAALHPRDIVGMHEVVPVELHVVVVGIVPEHGLPATRQVDALAVAVEVPDTIIGRHRDQRIAFLELLENLLVANAFEAHCQRRAEELHKQMQVGIPALYRALIGNSKETRDLLMDRKADDQRRADAQLVEAFEVILRGFRALESIGHFDNA